MEAKLKAEKNAKLEASNTRKHEMQELEVQRKRSEKPSDLEQVGMSYATMLIFKPITLL